MNYDNLVRKPAMKIISFQVHLGRNETKAVQFYTAQDSIANLGGHREE